MKKLIILMAVLMIVLSGCSADSIIKKIEEANSTIVDYQMEMELSMKINVGLNNAGENISHTIFLNYTTTVEEKTAYTIKTTSPLNEIYLIQKANKLIQYSKESGQWVKETKTLRTIDEHFSADVIKGIVENPKTQVEKLNNEKTTGFIKLNLSASELLTLLGANTLTTIPHSEFFDLEELEDINTSVIIGYDKETYKIKFLDYQMTEIFKYLKSADKITDDVADSTLKLTFSNYNDTEKIVIPQLVLDAPELEEE